ncbi:ATP-binding protein [Pseudoalteromonas sp. NZS100_1]|uniref:HD domain-containing protein n=1 Tax=Pseudoalteromonas sp. NZS100_1 TaxID=2792073 RepID=UPI0018CE2314|nr:ATP-binding protein [Pseudoalteromonas sp. NZS100_1]MBH0012019.1 ATP-binding protein [Pseudoalteromonas sp. NZS100_1]
MLHLPNRTKTLLEKSTALKAFVYSSISNLTPWISDNKPIFFPEYTDHGFTHLNEVLLTADSITSDESWKYLTPNDAAAMIISVLLHDCAMHITEDGFYGLIQDKFPKIESRHTNSEKSWSEVWNDYFSEAKRFDSKKLHSIFGDTVPVKNIPTSKIDLTTRDKLLIGEFIRRHHARMAHEIAFYGVPGVDGETVKLGEEPQSNFLDLCGFIARSHHLGLRQAVDMIEKNTRRVHLDTHVPFIMLLLRISDYIQIHGERAPNQLLHLKTLISPTSIGEWKKHDSIIGIHQEHDDPEAIYVDAEPSDAITYEELKKLFTGIQSELDLSWSVLGEVYGKSPHLKNFAIKIRRIRSSLDSFDEFITNKKPKYIPKVLSFRTADSEMMELLIAPLYGDKPEIGIRELVQNSIDACSELKDTLIKNGRSFSHESDFDVSITLDIKDGNSKIVIEDYGIGMTLDVIENYFLNIGASFRNSDRWKKDHETEGHSNVYRTGRFGIGLLAAYLLGDELEVETRHISQAENKALQFKCNKGSEKIIVSNIDFHIGTRITISINDHVRDILLDNEDLWDWFCLSSPKVIRKIVKNSEEKHLEQLRTVPNSDSNLGDSSWNRTAADGYDDILWTYEKIKKRKNGRSGNHLICNGIVVTDELSLAHFDISSKIGLIDVSTPSINVFDQDGRLPINLERSDLVGRYLPFQHELSKDLSHYLAKNLISFIKNLGPIRLEKSLINKLTNISVEGLKSFNNYQLSDVSKMLFKDNKLIPLDYELIENMEVNTIYVDAINLSENRGSFTSPEFVKKCDSYLFVEKITDAKSSRTSFIRTFFEFHEHHWLLKSGISALPICGRRILIKKTDVKDLVAPGYVPRTFWNRLECEWSNDDWVLMSIGSTPEMDLDLEKLTSDLNKSKSFGFISCYLDWDNIVDDKEPSFFSRAWLKENGQLPYMKND